jgi:hypothetical protein
MKRDRACKATFKKHILTKGKLPCNAGLDLVNPEGHNFKAVVTCIL